MFIKVNNSSVTIIFINPFAFLLRMNRREFMGAAMGGLVALITGCKEEGSGISEELQQQWPIWKQTDLEANRYSGPSVRYTTELKIKPNFYNGSMPLKYDFTQTFGVGHIIRHEFKDFSNYFIYDGSLLIGTVSVNNNNTMVAEARVNYSKEGVMLKPEMEEFHYANGLLVYHCISQIDNGTGIKIGETERSGKKQKDYFFILPFGISSGMPSR